MGRFIPAWARPQRGDSVVRAFPFTFDTDDLLTGHEVYTPTVGDILLDAWVEVDTAWNGTTPRFDLGQFLGGDDSGWFANGTPNALLLSTPKSTGDGGYLHGPNANPSRLYSLATGGTLNGDADLAFRWAPGRFVSDDPVKIVVSQDGHVGGADPGSTQGSATLYLVTATPL